MPKSYSIRQRTRHQEVSPPSRSLNHQRLDERTIVTEFGRLQYRVKYSKCRVKFDILPCLKARESYGATHDQPHA